MLTVHLIAVEESLDGVEVTCPERTLEMGESMVCDATYLLTQASGKLSRVKHCRCRHYCKYNTGPVEYWSLIPATIFHLDTLANSA